MVKKILYGGSLIIFTILLYHVYEYYSFTKERNAFIQEKGKATTILLKNQIDSVLSVIVTEGERLAKDFGANDYTTQEIEHIIKESSLKIPALQGITACYEKYAFSGDRELYCPYYDKGTGSYINVGESYDYTDESNDSGLWYTSVRNHGAKWVEPYFAEAAKDWYVDFGIPFTYASGPKKGQVRGTITMSFLTSGFKNLVHSLSIGKTGYGMVISNEGNFLSHPINDYIGTKNLSEVTKTLENDSLKQSYEALLRGDTGNIEFEDKEREDQVLFYYDHIPSSDWGIGLMFYKNELLDSTSALNHRFIKLALLLSAFLLIIIAIYFNKDYLDRQEIWQLSILATILLISNIFLIGYLEHTGSRKTTLEESPPIADINSLGSFINQQNIRLETLKLSKYVPVPTGIFIQRMAFENSYNLNVGGTIWQKYPLDIIDSVQIGFRLPQTSPFAEASFIEEVYRKKFEATQASLGYMLIGWDFRVTLQQYLNYENFPLDKRHINIEIVPVNQEDKLIFTPDLASYEFTNPSQKAGLNPNVKISGNKIMGSYFNYSVESYDTDFGYGSKTMFEEVPILHFNIDLRRILLNTFVTYLIPIFVTLIMMFILIVACSKTEERQGIIEGMAAFFFVLIFSHIDMRKEIITADLIFMEYFYFITYGMIILSTWNLITYAKNKAAIFDYNENQIFKASYFPFFFLCVLIVVLSKFY
ncbi:PDC sensor domain-containing protein [Costertonia aggregata]|uniref:Cache 3/Cache 2 fusion domain-containing protein n=1 Tax=Costertonia aggregata TaxID=343403 RepID=A0A7H9AJW4_9FLAO|nr:cache domain-containing protein [Costertonia aggregata]QLG43859.1 Cache 3/Cache 2 fusion domain-containing protein [Costertonia aggregata]